MPRAAAGARAPVAVGCRGSSEPVNPNRWDRDRARRYPRTPTRPASHPAHARHGWQTDRPNRHPTSRRPPRLANGQARPASDVSTPATAGKRTGPTGIRRLDARHGWQTGRRDRHPTSRRPPRLANGQARPASDVSTPATAGKRAGATGIRRLDARHGRETGRRDRHPTSRRPPRPGKERARPASDVSTPATAGKRAGPTGIRSARPPPRLANGQAQPASGPPTARHGWESSTRRVRDRAAARSRPATTEICAHPPGCPRSGGRR
ncbi:hypothetical protein DFJ68_1679 [Terracoccus luteus]|uniref:Uncharacterized protein n=1 Tax=Terracoccus luteus TaxID=53356 RepID=A0A495XXW3_9MICO|nr:hypothetical protein DFJ68_1679 [Terracoccus luteus]